MFTALYNSVSRSPRLRSTAQRVIRTAGIDISKLGNLLGCIEKNARNFGRTIDCANIGGGPFYKPNWGVLDYTGWKYRFLLGTVDWQHNLLENQPLPFADSSLRLAYTSHLVEHLPRQSNDVLFSEVYRALRPGGIFRVTTPDFDKGYDALTRNDQEFFRRAFKPAGPKLSMWRAFLSYFGSNYWGSRFSPEETKDRFRDLSRDDFLVWIDDLNEQIPISWIQEHQDHIYVWTVGKLTSALHNAGFEQIEISSPGKSQSPEMRGSGMAWAFDNRFPEGSMFIDAVKCLKRP